MGLLGAWASPRKDRMRLTLVCIVVRVLALSDWPPQPRTPDREAQTLGVWTVENQAAGTTCRRNDP